MYIDPVSTISDYNPSIKPYYTNHIIYIYMTGTGGSLPPEGGLLTEICSRSLIWTRSFLISPFWMSMIFSSWLISSVFWLSLAVPSSMFPWFCCLRMTPKAVSRSCTVVLDIFNSRRRSLISLMSVTFSCTMWQSFIKSWYQFYHNLFQTICNEIRKTNAHKNKL